ncbi:transmembrane protein 230 isoform X2 [Dermacentor albipictus]|uniref:transmembrane protein 230 isoform X2 n=1 Tax=Dermacentor albipictus TaxID=60249 RepID=UPI0031FBD6D4
MFSMACLTCISLAVVPTLSLHGMGRKDAAAMYDNEKKHFSNVKYQRMQRTDDGFVDIQFQKTLSRIPKKAIALATCLFIGGSALIVLASFIFAGFFDPKYDDSSWPVLVLGALMFIPGAYHVRIAYYAYKKYPGYTFDDIPDFD